MLRSSAAVKLPSGLRADGFGVVRNRVDGGQDGYLNFQPACRRDRLVVELDDVKAIEDAATAGLDLRANDLHPLRKQRLRQRQQQPRTVEGFDLERGEGAVFTLDETNHRFF